MPGRLWVLIRQSEFSRRRPRQQVHGFGHDVVRRLKQRFESFAKPFHFFHIRTDSIGNEAQQTFSFRILLKLVMCNAADSSKTLVHLPSGHALTVAGAKCIAARP